ncbi:MAG: hypothetical protein ACRC41_03575 [Sarcina sp.]
MILNSIKVNGCISTNALKEIPKKKLEFTDIIYNLKIKNDIKFIYEINLDIAKLKFDKMVLLDYTLPISSANININILYSNTYGDGCFLKETIPIVLKSETLKTIENIVILTVNLELNEESLIMFFCMGIIGENKSIELLKNIDTLDIIKEISTTSYDSTLDFL